MPEIRELIARRTDLSTFVVHLCRATTLSAEDSFFSILSAARIEARTPFGPAVAALQAAPTDQRDLDSQKVVCFTETPLEHLYLMLAEITDLSRNCRFAPFGVAITKRLARETGVNPVWYTDISPSGHDWLMNSVNRLIAQAVDHLHKQRSEGNTSITFAQYPIGRMAPFIEQMGTGEGYRKEFWWEREWRHRGHYLLPARFIAIAPEVHHDRVTSLLASTYYRAACLDPSWGLEEIIGRLAGFGAPQLGPF